MTRASVAFALAVIAGAFAAPTGAQASFGFLPGSAGFHVVAENQNTTATKQAGAHPYAVHVEVGLNTTGGESDGDLRGLTVHLPPGLLINPTAVNECATTAFHTARKSPYETSVSGESCPNSTQVGVIAVDLAGTTRYFGLFNLAHSFGDAAAIGASPFGTPLVFASRLRESDSGLDLVLENVPQGFDLQSMKLTIWGTPWEGAAPPGPAGHNPQRGNCLNEETGGTHGECLVFEAAPAPESQIKSYLTMPTTPCGQALAFAADAQSWQGEEATATATAAALEKCNQSLAIAQVQLRTANAAAATGLVFNLGVNDGGGILNPGGIARPAIKTAIAGLPDGLTINPSLAAGLGVCTEAQWALETAPSAFGAGCPPGSKIGDVTLEGALGLTETLSGSVFLAQPYANPFQSLIAVYMLAKLPGRGLIVKSEGKIQPDPQTGRLVATFDDLPRLLYTHFNLSLREGQRSALVSPPTCGRYPTNFSLADWAQPTVFRSEQTAFFIEHGEGGGACPSGTAPAFKPGLLAGSINPSPAAYTPFYLRMTRTDSEQEITSYSATFPPGMLAKIAGVTACPDAAIEAAKGLSGAQELAQPSCPDSSKIGHTMAGFGVGGTLAWAPGNLYLAGPYHGAPLSIVAVDSALIGPFDLGVVVVRSAIRIDPRSAQASIDSAGSDPIPHILAGIPLHLRDIRVYVDRPGFMLTPTSCDPMRVASLLTGAGADPFNPADDSAATSLQRYQLIGCGALGFKPRLALRVSGNLRHGGFPTLNATYTPRPGDANLQAISVALPPSLFLAQAHLKTDCTRPQFAHDACPPGSIIGQARVVTPLLDQSLEGPVYLRASDNPVPDLVADLHGRGIEIEVPGRIDSSPNRGIRANFSGLPDAPVTRATFTFPGGKHGLLENAEAICQATARGNARFLGQNNATRVLHPRLLAKCPHRRHRKRGSR